MPVPTYDKLFNPVIKALHELGGSGSVEEINDKVSEILHLSEEEINEIHRGTTTKLSYRLAWSRNYLKRYGLLENTSRAVWVLTQLGKTTTAVNEKEVKIKVRQLSVQSTIEEEVDEGEEPKENKKTWKDLLSENLMKLSPNAFEKMCQRLLRESGFIKVEITGKSGDGGIDGKGIIRLNGLLSFHIIFQCKRYAGSVSASQIRDFRGAMVGRADKGLFITTGSFTRDAKLEASRDGAAPIDLIDGDMLVEKMKELRLGVQITTQEVVEVNQEWFLNF